jgi:hypothetical protein
MIDQSIMVNYYEKHYLGTVNSATKFNSAFLMLQTADNDLSISDTYGKRNK